MYVYTCTDTQNHGFFLLSESQDICAFKMDLINICRPFSGDLGEQERRKAKLSCSYETSPSQSFLLKVQTL